MIPHDTNTQLWVSDGEMWRGARWDVRGSDHECIIRWATRRSRPPSVASYPQLLWEIGKKPVIYYCLFCQTKYLPSIPQQLTITARSSRVHLRFCDLSRGTPALLLAPWLWEQRWKSFDTSTVPAMLCTTYIWKHLLFLVLLFKKFSLKVSQWFKMTHLWYQILNRPPVLFMFTQGQIFLNPSDSLTSIAHKGRMWTDFINLQPVVDLLSCLMLRYWEGQIWSCWSFCVGFGLWLRGREPSSDSCRGEEVKCYLQQHDVVLFVFL